MEPLAFFSAINTTTTATTTTTTTTTTICSHSNRFYYDQHAWRNVTQAQNMTKTTSYSEFALSTFVGIRTVYCRIAFQTKVTIKQCNM